MKDDFHKIGWYASRISAKLPSHVFQPEPRRLWGGLAYLIVVAAGILSIGLFDLHPVLNLLISLVLGASFAGLGFLGHEILHGTVVKKPWLKDFLGAIAFFPLITGPRLWTQWHNLTHHVHTQDEERDPDAWLSYDQMSKSPLLRLVYRIPFPIRAFFSFLSLTLTFSVHSFRMFVSYIKETGTSHKKELWVQFIIPLAAWTGLLVWLGPLKWLFAYAVPLLIANFIVMAYIATNHRLNPLVPVNDPLANSLSVTVPRWMDILHFNFSYHTEHHLFPGMNPKYYPLVKEKIKEMWPERYHEMPFAKALVALWKTPRIYHQDTELLDPRRQHGYGSLGHGLDPDYIRSHHVDLKQPDANESELKKKVVSAVKDKKKPSHARG
ncbi:MAG: acyl-CoA desaturase [Bacillaceae bacterium]|nr:acyl-CoA desaturase [Bacillaceae bacterium]